MGIGLKSLRLPHTFTIEGTGAGTTDNEIVQHIGIVAKCKILGFLENTSQDWSNIVGQFGVGLYSTIAVAGRVEVFTKTYDATKGSQSCPTHVANVAKRLGSPDRRQSHRHPLRGSRRRHALCLIHLPPVLLLCVFGSTFQSLVVVAVCASKSFAVKRSSKLPRHSQLIRAEFKSNLSQSSSGCLRQDWTPVSWVEHHYSLRAVLLCTSTSSLTTPSEASRHCTCARRGVRHCSIFRLYGAVASASPFAGRAPPSPGSSLLFYAAVRAMVQDRRARHRPAPDPTCSPRAGQAGLRFNVLLWGFGACWWIPAGGAGRLRCHH